MKIFVTGGTGFIGSHLIDQVMTAGHEVVALRLPGSQTRIPLRREPTWINGNLETDVSPDIMGCDVCIHLAAYGVNPKLDSWQECFRWNVTGSVNCWLRAAEAGVKRFIITGSCFEYGRVAERYDFIPTDAPLIPTTPYSASKAAASMAALGFAAHRHVAVTVVRPFHVFGEGEGLTRFWPQLRQAALSGANFPMTSGGQVRDFTPVQEAARLIIAFAEKPGARGVPEIYNLGTGYPQTLLEFARDWWQRWNAKGELLPGEIPYRDNEIMRYLPKLHGHASG